MLQAESAAAPFCRMDAIVWENMESGTIATQLADCQGRSAAESEEVGSQRA
jgi:hypothetical protein